MGPFPHHGAEAVISPGNPAGLDGFAFVEFAHPEAAALAALFGQLGFVKAAQHRTRKISLWQQGDITFVLNGEPSSHGHRFMQQHGPSAPSMAWRAVDARHAFEHAVRSGAKPFVGEGKVIDTPAVQGIGGSLIYFVSKDPLTQLAGDFEWLIARGRKPAGGGFTYIDHLTHNVRRGNMDTWYGFYRDIFKFREIRFFNIRGKHTGLVSRALTSPCGRIRIPINESVDDASQIEEYLRSYRGEGIQHIALGTGDIYRSVDDLARRGMMFMPPPPATYYEMSHERVPGHREPDALLAKHGILIDGEGVDRQGNLHILLQIFSRTVIGPIFFEFIQRKGDDGFGEGNFKALFESIEADQIRRGVLSGTTA